MATTEKGVKEAATDVKAETSSYSWTLTAYQLHGNLWLSWSTTAPFRAQQGQIFVYSGLTFPPNPQDNVKTWSWDNENGGGSGWDTKLPWGTDWNCAWGAQKSPNGPYVYVVKVTTT